MKRLFIAIYLLFSFLSVHAGVFELAEKERMLAAYNLDIGNLDKAHAAYLRAIDLYSKIDTAYPKVSLCHYSMCISFFNQRDLPAMYGHIEKMAELMEKHPDDRFVEYDYMSVLSAYKSALYEEEPSDSLKCEIFTHLRRAIECQEHMSRNEWNLRNIMPTYNYMNIAVMYDLLYEAEKRDSVRYYLGKAREVNDARYMNYHDYLEGEVSIRDMQAWLYYYDKDYKRAEKEELEVLAIIDSLQSVRGNNVLTERGEAYSFLAMLYEDNGQYSKAIEYIEKRAENDRERFSAEKNRAIREIEAKYEVEKKEERILVLRRRNIYLAVVLCAFVVAVLMGAGVLLYRKRLREQRLYDEALTADALLQAKQTSLVLLAESLGITSVNLTEAQSIMDKAVSSLTVVDKKYILCFLSGESVKNIAARFNVEPASVYTVRYRLRRKFPKNIVLPF